MDKFNKICKDIKNIKVQGAENIAKNALIAYSLKPNRESINKLIKLRSTEPLLFNILNYAQKYNIKEAFELLKRNEKKIIYYGAKIIKNNSIIFTHCHSSTVINILKEAKRQGKNFEVYNTETRPLFQGRKTSLELNKLKIKVANVIDSAANLAIKKCNLMLIGSDAILKNGNVINKIGSGLFSEIAYNHKKPVYIASNSLKYSNKNIKIEERNFKEVWNNKDIKIINPAFEIVNHKYITKIISELGILNIKEFLNKVKQNYYWIK
jgi:translation initiation factor 2B subunit (eIF-2B alpha/beta/delta family)